MNRRRALTYLNCFCCTKTHCVEDLIEMSANPLQVCDQMVDFQDLILDVCSVKLNTNVSNYICIDCKEKLVQFHVFKRNIKGYGDFRAHVKTCSTLLKAEPLLADCDEFEELQCKKYGVNVVMIAGPEFHERYEAYEKTLAEQVLNVSIPKQESFDRDNRSMDETMSEEEPEDETLHIVDEDTISKPKAPTDATSIKKTPHIPPASTPKVEKRAQRNSEVKKVKRTSEKKAKCSEMKTKHTSSGAKSHRWNTNELLTPEHKDWISTEAARGTTHTSKGQLFTCTQCSMKLCSSWVLRKHLRDVHVIKQIKTENASR